MLVVTVLTELRYQTMYIHMKSTYNTTNVKNKIKVGHKNCVILLIRTPSVMALIYIALIHCTLTF